MQCSPIAQSGVLALLYPVATIGAIPGDNCALARARAGLSKGSFQQICNQITKFLCLNTTEVRGLVLGTRQSKTSVTST